MHNQSVAPDEETIFTAEKLNDKAYRAIKDKIIRHELRPGTRLVDSQLAERYGISRTPVRDAIRKLAEEGLVVSNGKKGYVVFQPTRQDIVELFEIRLVIDRAVIHKMINEMLPNNYDLYNKAIDRIESRLHEGIARGGESFAHYDEEFHDSFVKLANNSRLTDIYIAYGAQTKGFRYYTAFSQERIDKANHMHFRMLKALRDLNSNDALAAVTEHVEMSRRDALSDYEYFSQSPE